MMMKKKMKRHIIYMMMAAAATFGFTACDDLFGTEDELSSTSVITVDEVEETEFDKWLTVNLVQPYNIQIKYRYEYNESDEDYYTVPAQYDQAVEMAHIVLYSCIEAYNEVGGVTFTRTYFPKLFYLEGEWHYRNNGTFELGTAEGGKKINLMGCNYIDTYMTDVSTLNEYYLKTIHHEFTHILNQTIDYSASFQLITSTGYVADSWSDSPYDSDYLERGFISSYSQHSHSEDFAEMMSMYVTNTEDQWEEWMEEAGTTGRSYLESKMDMVKSYMSENFDIDLDELRDCVLRREQDIVDGKIDLTDLTIN